MYKLLQIYTKFRQYQSFLIITFLLSILLIILLAISIIITKHAIPSNDYSTISSTSSPFINESCHMSTASPIPCGCPIISTSKIINGQPANQAAWPWMVSYGPRHIHICGGVLIAPEYILTAAHYLHSIDDDDPIDISTIEIRLGLTNLNEVTTKNLFAIRKVTLHNDFNPSTYQNDIALIRLDRSVIQSDTIQMLCLPSFTSYIYPPVNRTVIAIGWGHTIDPLINPDSLIPTHLQQTVLPVLPLTIDKNNTNLCFEQEVNAPDQQFCAGYANGLSDTCQADSGSPIMLFTDQHWELVGLVSYGIGCGQTMLPGVYTRVSAFLEWITDRIRY